MNCWVSELASRLFTFICNTGETDKEYFTYLSHFFVHAAKCNVSQISIRRKNQDKEPLFLKLKLPLTTTSHHTCMMFKRKLQVPVVQRLDNANHWKKRYPVVKC